MSAEHIIEVSPTTERRHFERRESVREQARKYEALVAQIRLSAQIQRESIATAKVKAEAAAAEGRTVLRDIYMQDASTHDHAMHTLYSTLQYQGISDECPCDYCVEKRQPKEGGESNG